MPSAPKSPCEPIHDYETKVRLTKEDDELVTAYAKLRRYKKAAFMRRLVLLGLDALLNESALPTQQNEGRG